MIEAFGLHGHLIIPFQMTIQIVFSYTFLDANDVLVVDVTSVSALRGIPVGFMVDRVDLLRWCACIN